MSSNNGARKTNFLQAHLGWLNLNEQGNDGLNNPKAKTNLDALEYELIGKHIDDYKNKLLTMSESEIHEVALNRILDSLKEKNRLNKTNIKNQVIAFIGTKNWERMEKKVKF